MPPIRHVALTGGLILVCAGFVALCGSTVGSVDVQYDEFTDLGIALTLSDNPLVGTHRDPSQARLPMYVTALAHRLVRLRGERLDALELLPISRWISIWVTLLAILGTFWLGTQGWTAEVGLLAATLFAFATLTLQFARDAMTQGDAFTPLALIAVLLSLRAFERRRGSAQLFLLALSLAVAVAVKFSFVILIPALMTYQLLSTLGRWDFPVEPTQPEGDRAANRGFLWLYFWAALWPAAAAVAARWVSALPLDEVDGVFGVRPAALGLWLTALLGLALCFLLALSGLPGRGLRRLGSRVQWPLPFSWLVICPLTLAATLVLFPAHTFKPSIVASLMERSTEWESGGFFSDVVPAAKLYLGLLILKLGLPFGLATCLALVYASVKARSDRYLLLCMTVIVFSAALFLLLPLHQPYWLMSIYPAVTLVLAAMLEGARQNSTRLVVRLIVPLATSLALVWLLVGVVRSYPSFGLYGYEVVGDRWLGEDSRGYQGVVVITNDGSSEAMSWLRQHAPAGSLVLSCLDDFHILNHLHRVWSLQFELIHGLELRAPGAFIEALAEADFVLVRTIRDFGTPISLGDPRFVSRFGGEPAHRVLRGRGIYRMPVIEIYQAVREGKSL